MSRASGLAFVPLAVPAPPVAAPAPGVPVEGAVIRTSRTSSRTLSTVTSGPGTTRALPAASSTLRLNAWTPSETLEVSIAISSPERARRYRPRVPRGSPSRSW